MSVQFDTCQSVVLSKIRIFDLTDLIGPVLGGIPDALVGLEASGCFLLLGSSPSDEFVKTHRVHPVGELRDKEAIKFIVHAPEVDRNSFWNSVSEFGVSERYEYSVGWTNWAGVLPPGVTRASGLHELTEILEIKRAGTVAIGDGTSGVPVVRWTNFGTIMGDASQIIETEDDHVTGVMENDRAAAVIRVLLNHCGVAHWTCCCLCQDWHSCR